MPTLVQPARLVTRAAIVASIALTGWSTGAAGQPAVAPTIVFEKSAAASPAEREIRAVEQRMHDAYVKGDKSLFRSLYADDATFTYSDGETVTANERVSRLRPFADLRDTVQGIRFYGPDTAIVNMQSAYAGTAGAPVRIQIVRVWVKQEATWKVAAFQSTPVQ